MSVTNDPHLNMTKPQTMRKLWMNLPMSLVALGIAVIALTMTFMVVSERNYSNIVKSVAATRDGRDHLSLVYQLQTLLLNAETAPFVSLRILRRSRKISTCLATSFRSARSKAEF